jgi:DNA-directed RNA polymerase subunit E'/Rpb7
MQKMSNESMEQNKNNIYHRSVLTRRVVLKITEVGKDLRQNLERKINKEIEGKCVEEGFIRPNSVNIMQYSSGNVNGKFITFIVVFECYVCHPVSNMTIECVCTEITLGGILAEVKTDDVVPLVIFMMTDHNYTNKLFTEVKEGMKIHAKILGVRFELNDPYITAVGQLVDPNMKEKKRAMNGGKQRIMLGDNVSHFDEEDM